LPDIDPNDLLQIELPGTAALDDRDLRPHDADLRHGLRVASPCSASWEEMEGDHRIRFCRHCRKNVYHLSGMNRREAVALVRESEGQLCVRYCRRRDGTLLTDDCPVGLRTARRWLLTQMGVIMALFALLGVAKPLIPVDGLRRFRYSRVSQVEPFRTLFEWPYPNPYIVDGVFQGYGSLSPTEFAPALSWYRQAYERAQTIALSTKESRRRRQQHPERRHERRR
jgi:hypothetical protein